MNQLLSPKELGYKIKQVRRRDKISRSMMEEKEGYSFREPSLKEWENGLRYPSISKIDDLCTIFGYDFNTFLTVPFEEETTRTQADAGFMNETGLSAEGVERIKNLGEYETRFLDSLLKTDICTYAYQYAISKWEMEKYRSYLDNRKYRDAFDTVYLLTGVAFEDARKTFTEEVEKRGLPMPEDIDGVLNAFYAEQMIHGIAHRISVQITDALEDFTAERKALYDRHEEERKERWNRIINPEGE